MPRIPDSELERIKATVDLAALVRSRGVELKKHGARDLIGRCPFHEEASASFVVTPAKRIFHCLGCGAAGNVIQFVERFDGVSFRHAFELLAAGSGFATPGERRTIKTTVPKLEAPLDFAADDAELMKQIVDYYHERLMNAATGAPARDYLKRRGLDDEATLKRYKIGFADRSLGLRLPLKNRAAGADIRARLTRLGIYRESGHEHLNGCLIVPITSEHGEVTELYGRRLDDGGKSGVKHLYLPGPHVGIFNAAALNEPELILCEALLDALTFLAAGFANVSTIYGTEGFTDELFEALKRKKVQRVKLAYDADEAGERAAMRDAARLRSIGIEVYRIKFPWGMDANEYARKVTPAAQSLRLLIHAAAWLGNGAAPAAPVAAALPTASKNGVASHVAPAPSSSLAASLAADAHDEAAKKGSSQATAAPSAPSLIECGEFHTLAMDGREYRLAGLAKNNGVEALKLTLRVRCGERLHSDQLDLCRDLDRRRFIERAAEECALTADAVKRDLSRLLLACEQWQEARLRALAAPDGAEAVPAMTAAEEAEALALLKAPDLIERIVEAFNVCGLVGEDTNKLVALLACVSRKLDKPLAVIVQSTSAAGKTTLMEAVLRFMPTEERIKYSAMTGQSLYYLGETNLKHKILAIVEEEGAEKASYALKLLQSEGELTIASTGKDPNTGRMETQEYHVEGPVMIFLTTTAIDIDEELLNRCLILSVDESREQTERIHAMQREARTVEGIVRGEAREDMRRVMMNAQRLIKPCRIANDFAPLLTFSTERTRTRRDNEKYLTLIDSIALLHQHQRALVVRQINGRSVEMLPVTIADIATANRLAPEILGRSLDELAPQTRRLLAHIRALVNAKMESTQQPQSRCLFSRRELREACGWSEFQVRTHLEKLELLEYVGRRHGRQGVGCLHELLMDAAAPEDQWHIGLIDVAKLARDYDARFVQNGTAFEGTSSEQTHEATKPVKPRKGAA
jgi:DNA primase